jgi:hypothetical protein
VPINRESSLGAILLRTLCLIYLDIILCISFVFCTCWVPTISVLNLAIFPCYSNLLFKRRRWSRIFWWGVLGCVLPRLSFLWCYGVFRCSISHESLFSLSRHYLCNNCTLFVTFSYLWTLLVSMCGTIDPGTCIRWVHGFCNKIRYDRLWVLVLICYVLLLSWALMHA